MSEWFKEEVGSSIAGLMSYMDATGIEKVDDYTVRLNLNTAEIGVPEHLFHYPALMLNSRTFEGDFLKAPHGTALHTGYLYRRREVLLKARSDYWQKAPDGQPLPYLDEMEFIDMGDDTSAWMAAIKGGQVDYLDLADNVSPDFYNGLKDDASVQIDGLATGICRVLRMRVDIDPWTDNKVRQALRLCRTGKRSSAWLILGKDCKARTFTCTPVTPNTVRNPSRL